jgi:hypothetical protein
MSGDLVVLSIDCLGFLVESGELIIYYGDYVIMWLCDQALTLVTYLVKPLLHPSHTTKVTTYGLSIVDN